MRLAGGALLVATKPAVSNPTAARLGALASRTASLFVPTITVREVNRPWRLRSRKTAQRQKRRQREEHGQGQRHGYPDTRIRNVRPELQRHQGDVGERDADHQSTKLLGRREQMALIRRSHKKAVHPTSGDKTRSGHGMSDARPVSAIRCDEHRQTQAKCVGCGDRGVQPGVLFVCSPSVCSPSPGGPFVSSLVPMARGSFFPLP